MTVSALPEIEPLIAAINGDARAGADVRYSPTYDRIKAARKAAELRVFTDGGAADEALEWRKVRDLITDAIATESKDLQLGVWLVEALGQCHRFDGVARGLIVLSRLVADYWDGFPRIDPTDESPLEQRVTLLEWLDHKLPPLVSTFALTDRESRYGLVQYEAANITDAAKRKALIDSGWPTLETLNAEIDGARPAFREATRAAVAAALASLDALEAACRLRFKQEEPDGTITEHPVTFGRTREALASCQSLLEKSAKRHGAGNVTPISRVNVGDEPAADATAASEPSSDETNTGSSDAEGNEAAVVHVDAPLDRTSAPATIRRVVDYLRAEDASNPTAYLLARALAHGPLFACDSLDAAQPLPAPASALRQRLRALFTEESWTELLDESECAIAGTEKQAWLDPLRYSIVALEQLGDRERALTAIRSELHTLLQRFPGLAAAELEDGTPAASRDTQEWLRRDTQPAVVDGPRPVPVRRDDDAPPAAPAPSDVEAAMSLARSGHVGEAVALLQTRINSADSGRQRFLRKLELAELCLQLSIGSLAYPLLEELAKVVDEARLDQWEDRELLARVWRALYRCCAHQDRGDAQVEARARDAFARLCRLDPAGAIALEREPQASRWRRRSSPS